MKRPSRLHGTRANRTLFVLPAILDDLEPDEKNSIALRNRCATEGRGPSCGTVGEVIPDALPGIYHFVFRHGRSCKAATDNEAA